ncbi:peroxidase 20 [Asparagus officinalis]|uniref:peroxidase 20 n=1 Tax=Asparagus officinalis TaxID=4686 RepID=UPI00098E6C93|nr:peroxidase 20 [Asparagus officinalis]
MELMRLHLRAKFSITVCILLFHLVGAFDSELSPYYYSELCPLAEEIVRQNVEAAVYRDPLLAAALLRLHFHDCFVLGCDASLLLDDTVAIVSEKTAVPNLNSLRGFEVIDRIKYLLEEACPLTVSCADILAIVARDAVVLRGGPSWEVYLGRKDSLQASVTLANKMIPAPNSTLEVLIANFAAQGLDVVDLVALSGSHTIGRSRCTSFKGRLYGQLAYEGPPFSLEYRSYTFRSSLQAICPTNGRDNALVPLDLKTSRRFDNQYYLNLLRGLGLLQSDEALVSESVEESVIEIVWAYAQNQELFFRDFAKSMIKMGNINVLTGSEGQVREHCRYLNV